LEETIDEGAGGRVAATLKVHCDAVAYAALNLRAVVRGLNLHAVFGDTQPRPAVRASHRLKLMSIKLILAFILFGLVCYILGRRSGRRSDTGQMLQTSAPRTFTPMSANMSASTLGMIDAAVLEEIKRQVRAGQLINAIKLYRQRTNCSLREAKDAVDSIARGL
jgi:hypothetical protein